MSRKTTPPTEASDLDAALEQALKAAAAATDAAHDAEAVLAARTDAAEITARTARRMGWLAAITGAGAVLMALIAGGALWRASALMGTTAEIQAAATAALIERVTELNGALDRMDETVARAETLTDRLDRPADMPPAGPREMPQPDEAGLERLRSDLLAAIATAQTAILDRFSQMPAPAPAQSPAPPAASAAPAQPGRQTAPRPAARPEPRQEPRQERRATPRPAPAEPNPFRFP